MNSAKLQTSLLVPLVLSLASCSGGDSADPATTTTAAPTTTSTEAPAPATTLALPSTTRAPATTTASTTTEAPAPLVSGLVWESEVDTSRVNQPGPVPTQTANGVTVSLQLALYGPALGAGDFSADCTTEVGNGTDKDCLLVQLSMDVAPDFRVDGNSPEASMQVDAAITPDGRQISSIWSASGYPGTKGTWLGVFLPGAVPGSTIKVSVGSNLVGYSILSFDLPAEFLPTQWAG